MPITRTLHGPAIPATNNGLVESAFVALQMQGLAARPESTGARLLMQQGPRKVDTVNSYVQSFGVYTAYCNSIGEDCYTFSVELAFLFAAFMLTRIARTGRPIQSIRTYFSAMNYCFKIRSLGEPWMGGTITDLNRMYELASKQWRIDRGISAGNLRTEIPGTGLRVLFYDATAAMQESITNLSDKSHGSHTVVCWFAVFLVQLLFWFRADTIAGYRPGDIRFNQSGAMDFTVRRLKRGTAHAQPFSKSVPAPQNPILAAVFAVIRHAVTLTDDEGSFVFSNELWGDKPKQVSDQITKAMDSLLRYDQLFISQGSFVSSHSWRRTGASGFAAAKGDWHVLTRWGMWKVHASAEAYVNSEFQPDSIFVQLYEFLFQTISASQTAESYNGWIGYESASDLAEDGIFNDASLEQ